MPEMNYYYKKNHPLKPFIRQTMATPGTYPPDNATRTPPPFAPAGKWPAFSGNGWILIDNHIDETGWVNGQPFEIKDYGPYPEGWSATAPPPSPAEVKERTIQEIKFRLAELDQLTIRPIRAIEYIRKQLAAGGGDTARLNEQLTEELRRLAELEAEAEAKRAELDALRG
jgi:hypothetical protein